MLITYLFNLFIKEQLPPYYILKKTLASIPVLQLLTVYIKENHSKLGPNNYFYFKNSNIPQLVFNNVFYVGNTFKITENVIGHE